MADSPNPHAAHEHLFDHHVLARARQLAVGQVPASVVVGCVLCGQATTIESVARTEQGGGGRAQPAAGAAREVVVGTVSAAAPTSSRGMVRLSVGSVVVFASRAAGHADALGAAAQRGDQVRVIVQRVGGDLYVREVAAL